LFGVSFTGAASFIELGSLAFWNDIRQADDFSHLTSSIPSSDPFVYDQVCRRNLCLVGVHRVVFHVMESRKL